MNSLTFFIVLVTHLLCHANEVISSSSSINITNSSTSLYPSTTSVPSLSEGCYFIPATCICNTSTPFVNMTTNLTSINMTQSVSESTSTIQITPSSVVNGSMNATVNATSTGIPGCNCYQQHITCSINITATSSPSFSGSAINWTPGPAQTPETTSTTTSTSETTTSTSGTTTSTSGTTTSTSGTTTSTSGTTTSTLGSTSGASTSTVETSTSVDSTASTTVSNTLSISPSPTSTPVATTSTIVCQETDCAGVPCGTAFNNTCGFCVGGTTGLNTSHGRDCRNECHGIFRYDDCAICSSPREDDVNSLVSTFRDCHGTCGGSAELDFCGQCAGGDTGNAMNFTKDACDVCDGDGSSCAGCDGVPNSGKLNDACGVCDGDGTTCTTITHLSRTMMPLTSETSRDITVYGGGLDGDGIKCFLGAIEFQGTVVSAQEATCSIPNTGLTVGLEDFTVKIVKEGSDVDTAMLSLTVYDPVTTKVTTCTPAELMTGDSTELVFNGENFQNSSDAVCIVNDTPFTATFYTDTMYKCLLPPFDSSTELLIDLSLNGIDKLASDTSLTRTVFAPPPILSWAKFSDTGALVEVEFDKDVDTSSLINCDDIFTTVVNFGVSAVCTWSDNRHLWITPGTGATIVPSNELILKPDTVKSAGEQYSKYASGDTNILSPDSLVVPQVIITGPSQVSSCGHLCLDGGTSTGSGGRSFTTCSWGMSGDNQDADIISFLQSQNGETKVCINGTLMDPSVPYTFTLDLANFLGGSSQSSITATKSADPLPEVMVEGPLGGEVYAPDSFYIRAFAEAASCSTVKTLSYAWTVACTDDDASNTAKNKVIESSGYIGSSTKSALKIDPEILVAGKTYTFTVVVTAGQVATTVATEVVVLSSELLTEVTGGDRTIGRDSAAISIESSTIDPDNMVGSVMCSWICTDLSNGQACFSAANPLSQIILPDTCAVEILGSEFNVGTYELTSAVTKGVKSSSSSITLTVIPGNPPVVSVSTAEITIASNEKVNLAGKYTSSIQPSSVEWVCSDDPAYSFIDLTGAVISSSTNTYNQNADSFAVTVLKADVLSPGATYQFKINVNDGNNIGTSNMVVTVRTGPTSGTFDTSLTDMSALESLTMSAPNWVTDIDSYPLKYEFGYLDSDGNFISWITQTTDEFTINVPPGYGANNELPLRLYISDASGAQTSVDKIITVAPSLLTDEEVEDLVDDVVQSAQETGDYSETIPLIANVLAASDNTSNAITDLSLTTLIDAVGASLSEDTAVPLLNTFLDLEAQSIDMGTENVLSSFEKALDEAVNHELDAATIQATADWFDSLNVNMTNEENVAIAESVYHDIARGLSNSLDLGETSAEITTDDVTISAVYTLLIDNVPTKASGETAEIEFGGELAGMYGDWPCGGTIGNCYGVILQIVQYNDDLFSEGSDFKPSILSDSVIDLEFLNPATGEVLDVQGLSEPMKLTFNTGEPSDGKTFKAYYKDPVTGNWMDDGLTTVVENGVSVVSTDHCTVFAIAEEDAPTTADVTTAHIPDQVVDVSLVLSNITWDDVYLNETSPNFTSLSTSMINALTTVYQGDSSLKNIDIIGFEKDGDKIKAIFRMTFDGASNSDPAETLRTSIADGNLAGLSVDKDSLTWKSAYDKKYPASQSDDDDTAMIIGIVFGVFIFLAIILIVLALVKNRKSRNKVRNTAKIQQEETAKAQP